MSTVLKLIFLNMFVLYHCLTKVVVANYLRKSGEGRSINICQSFVCVYVIFLFFREKTHIRINNPFTEPRLFSNLNLALVLR